MARLSKTQRGVASRSLSPTLNHIGEERVRTPITLPHLSFAAVPLDDTAHHVAELVRIRTIRHGLDCWRAIGKADSLDAWLAIGKALLIGKTEVLRATQVNAAWGATYSKAFGKWMKEHQFGEMHPSDRSCAIELAENISAITEWRAGLSDKQRSRLRTAQSNVRRWRLATGQVRRRQCPDDLKVKATQHWRRFVGAMRLLPPGEAEALWQQSLFEMVQR